MDRITTIGSAKRATNVTLPALLVEEAKSLGINVSKACEAGLSKQVAETKSIRWLNENREAIQSYNAWLAEHGLPYDEFRQY